MKQAVLLLLVCVGCKITVEFPGSGQNKNAKPSSPEPFINTLGMKFVPVPGTDVKFSIWETRVKDYATYANANEGVAPNWKDPAINEPDTLPVARVSWNDAQDFCTWLTKKELVAGTLRPGQRYRLPTDAEWSVAVGLGKEPGNSPREKDGKIKGVYPWGKVWPPPKGAGNYDQIFNTDSFEEASPVGSFLPNKHGLYDMGGNLWELCEDFWHPISDRNAIMRGGCWANDNRIQDELLSSRRNAGPAHYRGAGAYKGFRCVLTNGSGR